VLVTISKASQTCGAAIKEEGMMTITTIDEMTVHCTRKESDSLGVVEVPVDKLWGAQTQRSLEHFSIGTDLIPREMIDSYAILKKAAATANHRSKRLDDQRYKLIVQTCDEILAGQHRDMFPLHVWMTGSGTQFNMNVNEVIPIVAANSPVLPSEARRQCIRTIT
jgi:fumarate hydratase class II